MANITIRNLDDIIVEKLKARARKNGRSMEAELRVLLAEVANRPSPKTLRTLAEHIAAMTPDALQTDSTKIIREFRDR